MENIDRNWYSPESQKQDRGICAKCSRQNESIRNKILLFSGKSC